MSRADMAKWEARWRGRDGPPAPPEPFLVRHAATLRPGRVLDVAAGDGRNALWLAARGFAVTALDIAPSAMDRLAATARDRKLLVTTRTADLDAPDALHGLGSYDNLVIVHFKPSPAHWTALLAGLRPGGRALLCSFGLEQHRQHGFPADYCLEPVQLTNLLGPKLRLLQQESFVENGAFLEGFLWERPPA